jgi:hypothetical protein
MFNTVDLRAKYNFCGQEGGVKDLVKACVSTLYINICVRVDCAYVGTYCACVEWDVVNRRMYASTCTLCADGNVVCVGGDVYCVWVTDD